MTDRVVNEYYVSFPQSEYDRRFSFPERLTYLNYVSEDHRNGPTSEHKTYKFDIEQLSTSDILLGPRDYDFTAVHLSLDQAPDSHATGLHRCIIYLSKHGGHGMTAVGRGMLVVLQKWLCV